MEKSDFEEKMSLRGKGKEIMVEDMIDSDSDVGLSEMIKEIRLGGDYKGKDSIIASHGIPSDAKKGSFFKEQGFSSTSAGSDGILNGNYQNNFPEASSDTDQDDYSYSDEDSLEYLIEEEWSHMNDFSYLEDQLEKAGIPAGIEAVIPWMTEPGQNPFNVSSPSESSSTQPILGSGLNQTTHSHDSRSLGDTSSSAGFSDINGDKSVHHNHGSHGFVPNNCATSSFVPTPTKFSGENSGTSSATSLYKNAMTWLKQFENFAIVDDYSDHYYGNKPSNTQPQRAWVKKIQDEWKILESSLPDTIFVRAYESRMDLLRAVIIGPQGTPYHDGLFFFDVMLPSRYPDEPPSVNYHSGGLRLNPNLYMSGKVCLSLLGTWPGSNVAENWIPGKSTLLQVLVSIQALVLNAKPFYNEPGYPNPKNEVSNYLDVASERYNEKTLIQSLTTMLYSMRRPPKHFEEFTANHFISRSHDILLACKAYMDGAKIGSIYIVDGKAVIGSHDSCSRYLKDSLGATMNSLIDEFSKLGLENCDVFRVPVGKNKEHSSTLDMSPPGHNPNIDKFQFSNLTMHAPGAPYLIPPPPVVGFPFPPQGVGFPFPPQGIGFPFPPQGVGFALPPPNVGMNPSRRVWNPSYAPRSRRVRRPRNYLMQKSKDLDGKGYKSSDG